jgi:hypothetical protein
VAEKFMIQLANVGSSLDGNPSQDNLQTAMGFAKKACIFSRQPCLGETSFVFSPPGVREFPGNLFFSSRPRVGDVPEEWDHAISLRARPAVSTRFICFLPAAFCGIWN